jgi:hypothetical protein
MPTMQEAEVGGLQSLTSPGTKAQDRM